MDATFELLCIPAEGVSKTMAPVYSVKLSFSGDRRCSEGQGGGEGDSIAARKFSF